MMDWKDKFSVMVPVVGLGAPLAGTVTSFTNPEVFKGSSLAWLMLFAWAVFSEISTKLLKRGAVYFFPGVEALRRPSGATRCDAFSSDDDPKGGNPGFPSGHSSLAGMYAAILLMGLFFCSGVVSTEEEEDDDGEGRRKTMKAVCVWRVTVAVVVAIALVGLNAYVRISKQCHNGVQVLGGTVWGLILGVTYVFAAGAVV